MAEYTTTREGFQHAMKESLGGDPNNSRNYAEKTAEPGFYHLFNGNKLEREQWVESLDMWRGKITDYEPKIHEFLRDGDQLAARMDGVIKLDGAWTYFESFLFAKVNNVTGRLEHLIERSVWGTPGEAASHGATMGNTEANHES